MSLFLARPFARNPDELARDLSLTSSTWLSHATRKADPRVLNAARAEGNQPGSNANLSILSKCEKSVCQYSSFPSGYGPDPIRVESIKPYPLTLYIHSPSVRYGVDRFCRPLRKTRDESLPNSFSFLSAVPRWNGENIIEARNIDGDSTHGDHELTIECSDLTARVIWWSVVKDRPAVSGDHKLVLRELKDYDGPGLDLGVCRTNKAESEHEGDSDSRFHAFLEAGENSLVSFPDKKIICYGCIITTKDGRGRWFQIIK
jgi:hypothetical protein